MHEIIMLIEGAFAAIALVALGCYWLNARTERMKNELHRRRRSSLCVHCGYDLRGGQSVCPECGHFALPRDDSKVP